MDTQIRRSCRMTFSRILIRRHTVPATGPLREKCCQDGAFWSDARQKYSGVAAPVTLIYGEKDWSRPSERERTAASFQNVKVVTLPNAGHFTAVETPRDVAAIILATPKTAV